MVEVEVEMVQVEDTIDEEIGIVIQRKVETPPAKRKWFLSHIMQESIKPKHMTQ